MRRGLCSLFDYVFVLCADDETRVQLKEGPDYVNANFVNVSLFVCKVGMGGGGGEVGTYLQVVYT